MKVEIKVEESGQSLDLVDEGRKQGGVARNSPSSGG